ncbi:MAG: lipid-A-disaccharide synthase [Gammaproteobacteria bacterium]|nr:lipid-A-disaccharide synthase [Gammaproteobacteria bacterium]
MPLRIGIVAGESSGDALGSGLMRATRQHVPDVEFTGVGGERMLAEGLVPRADISCFNVNGFVDPLKRLPDLLRTLRDLVGHFTSTPMDVVVGVDFNVFNLLLERRVKRRGIPTAHYVSPSVYAWRRGRVKKIGRSTDVVMALFPFEPALYEDRGVRAVFVGHPLADEIAQGDGGAERRRAARTELGLPDDVTVIALLPGSRMSEIDLMADTFLRTAVRLAGPLRPCAFVVPCANPRIRDALEARCQEFEGLDVRLADGNARAVLAACDGALVKSGTGTLEAMLLRRPMAVTYRLGAVTYRIVKALKRSEFVALPNILSGRPLVPELLQDDAGPEVLPHALRGDSTGAGGDRVYLALFVRQHANLRRGGSENAARTVLSLVHRC